jgi:hypothetical protein
MIFNRNVKCFLQCAGALRPEVSVRVGREMLLEVTKQEAVKMQRCSGAFVDGVGAVRVLHEIDGLVQLDQAIEQ